jgi:hypothetical protein
MTRTCTFGLAAAMLALFGCTLEGSMVVRVDGGLFPYYVKYSYPNRAAADVLISCTEPAP